MLKLLGIKLTTVFDQLDDRIRKMLEERGMTDPTEAQSILIPSILRGSNAILISPTGSGKTEAAILPIFHKILRDKPLPVSTIFVTPLRALNRDMLGRLVDYGRHLGIRIQVRHSDINATERRKIVTEPADVLITTPESLQILLKGKRLREVVKSCRYLIVDELHELAQSERGSQFSVAVERLDKLCGGFQRIGLSATIGNAKELGKYLSPVKPPVILESSPVKKLDLSVTLTPKGDKDLAEKLGCDEQYAGSISFIWERIMEHNGTLVFVNTRSVAEDLSFRLRLWLGDIPIMVHHGSLSRETRETAEIAFKKGEIKALICTSSLELGIDIGSADLVIQFNSPRQVNRLIQRVGRSGHWIKKTSKGFIVCNDVIELEEALAISELALSGYIEDVRVRKGSLATLANQIISELNCVGKMKIREFYDLVKRTYPYQDMSEDEFTSLIDFLHNIRKIWVEGDEMGRKGSSLTYFIENISMIPSEKTYKVIDVMNRKFIGTLDERYVVNEIEPGSYFVMKGATWRTRMVEKERILVEPYATAAIAPKWTGEDIPVPQVVAEMVSSLRSGKEFQVTVDDFGRNALREWHSGILGRSTRPMIETRNGEIIMQILLGTKGNFALAEIMSGMLSMITGESIEMDYSPYSIYFRTTRNMGAKEILGVVKSVDPDRLESYVEGLCRRSRFFSSVFLYEARKFGIISNDAEIGRIRFEKIVDSYFGTPVFKDSVSKLIWDYMDLEAVSSFLIKLRSGQMEFILNDNITETSRAFLTHYSERVLPLKPTKTILDSIKRRIMNEETTLVCTRCGNVRTMKVRDIDSIKCPVCGSSLVAALSDFERDVLRKPGSMEDRLVSRRLYKNAHLVRERGILAVMALAAHGIGPETASRLLEVSYQNEDDFIRAILNAEMEYAKNKRFWD